jgi:hypothetical protein
MNKIEQNIVQGIYASHNFIFNREAILKQLTQVIRNYNNNLKKNNMYLSNLKKEKLSGVIEKFGISVKTYILENYKEYVNELDQTTVQDIYYEMQETFGNLAFYYTENGRKISNVSWGYVATKYLTDEEKEKLEDKLSIFTINDTPLSGVFFIKDRKAYSDYLLNIKKEEQERLLEEYTKKLEKEFNELETLHTESIRLGLNTFSKSDLETAIRKEKLEKLGLKEEDLKSSNGLTRNAVENMIDEIVFDRISDHEYNSH